jgi:DNA repair and recombination protein RAD52
MTFTDTTRAELAKPLNRSHVKPPAPGKYGDYIEGWRTIDEANRIFGFDGWTRETADDQSLLGEPRQFQDKWRVDYIG